MAKKEAVMEYNIILDSDSYKASHWMQYPPGTRGLYSYLESRGGRYGQTVFFGLQYYLKEYLTRRVTKENVEEAAAFFAVHGEPFNKDGWMYIVNKLGGRIPVKIRAVPEGMVVPTHNVLMTVESTDPNVFWVASYIETVLMRLWYSITVATQSWHIRKIIEGFLEKTSDAPGEEIDFKLHDFGSRGVSSSESAGIGGMAHLVNFKGSDTVNGVVFANRYYKSPMAAFSIPAAEHSTMTAWGKEREVDAYRNMLKQYAKPGALVAVVSDSYDLWNAVENIWGGALKDEVVNSGATIVVRPDSGNPPEVVLRTLQILDKKFGSFFNKKGYKVLNHVRVIQGDGINEDSIREILRTATWSGYSATNVCFGMGGALLQKVDRDTQKFAYKCSEVNIDGQHIGVCKTPVTDMGKASKKGRLDLVRLCGKIETAHTEYALGSVMSDVFKDGEILKEYTLEQVRHNALQEA
jgi:nicotinamide phosphoribosyltransferase